MREIKNISDYRNLVHSDKPILIDFYADWCGPCQAQLPILEKFAANNEGTIEVAKVNVDHNSDLAQQYGVRSIPALFFIQDNKVVERFVGIQSEKKLQDTFEGLLSTTH